MGKCINKVILLGNIGTEPELRTTTNGTSVCSFSMATNSVYLTKDKEKKEQVEWHKIVAWGKTGEVIAQYLSKGDRIYVEGRKQTRQYEDKDGTDQYIVEIIVNDMVMLGGGSSNGSNGSTKKKATKKKKSSGEVDPFNEDIEAEMPWN